MTAFFVVLGVYWVSSTICFGWWMARGVKDMSKDNQS